MSKDISKKTYLEGQSDLRKKQKPWKEGKTDFRRQIWTK